MHHCMSFITFLNRLADDIIFQITAVYKIILIISISSGNNRLSDITVYQNSVFISLYRKKIPEPFERKRRAIEERFSSLSQEKIREIEKRKEQGDAAEQRVSVLAKNSMENNVRDSVQGNDGNNAQNPIQNPAQNTTGNMSGSVDSYSGVHGENSENATEISNRRSSIEERIARLHVGENNAIKKEIDDVIP